MSLLMEPGQTYNSYDELKAALDTHCKENKVIFNIANAKTVEQSNAFMKRGPFYDPRLKYSHCVLQCKHYGSYTSSSAGLRPKQRSYKIDCRAFISISACRKENYLIIRDSYHKHSHPCTEEIYNSYPEVRRMTKDERRMVGTLLDMGVPVSQIKSAVGKNVTPKDLHNAKVHIRAIKMGFKSDEPKSRPATKRNNYLLNGEDKEEMGQTRQIISDLEEENMPSTTIDTHPDSIQCTSQNDTDTAIPHSDEGIPLSAESNSSNNAVSEETFLDEKTLESGDANTMSNLLNAINSNTESVITVTNSDGIDGDRASYTVIVSTAEGEKGSTQVVTSLQELFNRLQTEGLPKKEPASPGKLPKPKLLEHVQGQTEGRKTCGPENKNCENCGKYMSPLDGHSLCLVCLGPQHLHQQECEHCSVMKPEQLNIRRKQLVRMRMNALKELNESKRHGTYMPDSSVMQTVTDGSLFQTRKSKRIRKPKDFGPDISVQNIFSNTNKSVSTKTPKVTKCVVSDGEKEYMVEIPKREPEEDFLDFSMEAESSTFSSHSHNTNTNTERFNHLLKQTAVFEDVVVRPCDTGALCYEPDVNSVLEMNKVMSHSSVTSIPNGIEGKYNLDSQFESSYCSVPAPLDVPGDPVLNAMGSGLHKLAQNATVQTRLAIYDKLFTRLGVGMADEALGILSQLYGKVTHVTEISQEDLTNDLQTALDTIQALKDVLEELGIMSKDALSTASHQRSISLHSLDKAKQELKKPLANYEITPPATKRRKFEPFTKQRLITQIAASDSQSLSHSISSDCSDIKLESNISESTDEEIKHHIVMEVSSLPSEISSSVLGPIMTVSPMSLSGELLERLQSHKDGIIELNMVKEDELLHATSTAGAVEVDEVIHPHQEDTTVHTVHEVIHPHQDTTVHTSGETG